MEINIDPIAFLNIRWYGIMIALAIITIILWVMWEIKKGARISNDALFAAAIVGIPSGVIVSRLIHVIDRWDYYGQNIGHIFGGDGLTIYGAIIGGTLGVWIYSKFARINFGYFMDLIAPGLVLAQVIGRVGCFLNGCCYGDVCDLPWAIIYTHPDSLGPIGQAVHPTMVYEIIFLLIVFVFIFYLRGRFRTAGTLFAVYMSLYALWRFGIDFMREGTDFLFGLHQAQVISIIVLMITVPLLILKARLKKVDRE